MSCSAGMAVDMLVVAWCCLFGFVGGVAVVSIWLLGCAVIVVMCGGRPLPDPRSGNSRCRSAAGVCLGGQANNTQQWSFLLMLQVPRTPVVHALRFPVAPPIPTTFRSSAYGVRIHYNRTITYLFCHLLHLPPRVPCMHARHAGLNLYTYDFLCLGTHGQRLRCRPVSCWCGRYSGGRPVWCPWCFLPTACCICVRGWPVGPCSQRHAELSDR